MKLARYNHFDPVNLVITGENEYKVPYNFFDTVPNDYTDITSIENIEAYGFDVEGFDYKRTRDEIKLAVEAKGWANLTANEKTIATTHKIGTHAERLAALGGNIDQLVQVGVLYHSNVSEVRKIRLAYAVSAVHNHLEHIQVEISAITFLKEDNSGLTVLNDPPATPNTGDKYIVGGTPSGAWVGYETFITEWDGSQWTFRPRIFITLPEWILSRIDPDNLIYKFLELGLGGIIDGDNASGLLDYLNDTAGTKWQNNGLRSEPYTPEGLANMSVFADKLLDILQKGIY